MRSRPVRQELRPTAERIPILLQCFSNPTLVDLSAMTRKVLAIGSREALRGRGELCFSGGLAGPLQRPTEARRQSGATPPVVVHGATGASPWPATRARTPSQDTSRSPCCH